MIQVKNNIGLSMCSADRMDLREIKEVKLVKTQKKKLKKRENVMSQS